ncbi:helix-turn-helix domain-containing protein [Pelagerythrobacter marinus]|uniref:helix-turn-helix domain-containing protein n=1 Tax=Pelagerythrobacter marinus TaxID=538382 RepID=UPI002AC8EEF0|nr:helix-turn-helix domain-containing protein [Pelagerythrobacter marinus]WPZ05506.1 helix-turn-helix domain-containing protein [Pelagerythrobacter marinus]
MTAPLTQEERERVGICRGSAELLAALWREHPERMEPLYKAGHAPAPSKPPPPPLPPIVFRPLGVARDLLDSVAEDFGVSHGEIIGNGRSAKLVEARAVVITILRARGWSYPQIGKVLGDRDHSTVIHVAGKLDIYAERNPVVGQSLRRHDHLMARGQV